MVLECLREVIATTSAEARTAMLLMLSRSLHVLIILFISIIIILALGTRVLTPVQRVMSLEICIIHIPILVLLPVTNTITITHKIPFLVLMN